MTTKVLSGTYANGYTLNDGVSFLSITASGKVGSATGKGIFTAFNTARSNPLTIQNDGHVQGPSTGPSQAIYIRSVSTVAITNGSASDHAALVVGGGNGVFTQATGGGSTLTNWGTVEADYGPISRSTHYNGDAAVLFDNGGRVTNGALSDTAALILAGYRGVEIFTGAGTVTNYGTITSIPATTRAATSEATGSIWRPAGRSPMARRATPWP